MEKIIKKYLFLEDEKFKEIVSMIFEYVEEKELTGTSENKAFFRIFVKKDVDKMLKDRKRALKNYNKKKEIKK